MCSIWSSSPLKPWRVPGNSSIHRLGMDPSQARRLWLGPTFPLGFLAELGEFSTGAKTPSIAATSWGTGETYEFQEGFFGWMKCTYPYVFSFRSGWFMCRCDSFKCLFLVWVGQNESSTSEDKTIYIYIRYIDCRCWMSAFDEFCLLGLLKHWRTWKWMKLCNSGDQIWLKRKFILVLLKPCSWKKVWKKPVEQIDDFTLTSTTS